MKKITFSFIIPLAVFALAAISGIPQSAQAQTATPVCPPNFICIPTTESRPAMSVISPNGGERWPVGSTQTIKWSNSDVTAGYNVQIGLIDTRYSSEGGERAEQIIANSISNTGSYEWTVPRAIGTMDLTVTDQSVYRVVVHSWSDAVTGVAAGGSSAMPFAIASSTDSGTGTFCYVFTTNLQLGATGADVVALQTFLVGKGFAISDLSLRGSNQKGYFGRSTFEALKKYQTSVGLPSTGFLGPLTRAKMNGDCSNVTPVNPVVTITGLGSSSALPGERVALYATNLPRGTSYRYYVSFTNSATDTSVPATISPEGTYLGFEVPRLTAGAYQISAGAYSSFSAANYVPFTIQTGSVNPGGITVTSPVQGSVFDNGDSQNIIVGWQAYTGDFDAYRVYIGNTISGTEVLLSYDAINKNSNGYTFTKANLREFWSNINGYTPEQIKNSYYVRVTAVKNGATEERIVSNGKSGIFTITTTGSPTTNPITVVAPTAGVTWTKGQNNNIAWNVQSYPTNGYLALMLNDSSGQTVGIIKNLFFSNGSRLTNQNYTWDTKTMTSVGSNGDGTAFPVPDITTGTYKIRAALISYDSSVATVSSVAESPAFTISTGSVTPVAQACGEAIPSTTNPNPSPRLFNVDFGPQLPATTNKTGAAIVGSYGDFWNTVSVPWCDSHSKSGLKNADGSNSQITVGMQNLGGSWAGTPGVSDAMLASFAYPAGNKGGNAYVYLSNVPGGTYDLYLYNKTQTAGQNGDYTVNTSRGNYGRKTMTTDADSSKATTWQENNQFVVFKNVQVDNGGKIYITIQPSVGGLRDAQIAGLQLAPVPTPSIRYTQYQGTPVTPPVCSDATMWNGTSCATPVTPIPVTPIPVTPVAIPFVQIISPNGGGYYKNDGSVMEVNWYTSKVPSTHVFDVIRLRAYPNGQEYNIAYSVQNSGQARIAIPSTVPAGAYTLEMKTYVGNTLVMDASDSYFKIISEPVTPPQPVAAPTVSFTIEGQDSYVYSVGQVNHFRWSSTNADSFSSYSKANDPVKCGEGGWVANNAQGTSETYLGGQWAGCVWTVTYIAKNSQTGQSASKTVKVTVNPVVQVPPTDASASSNLGATIWDAVKSYVQGQ